MQHDISLNGHAFALRPVGLADAGFIAELRANPALNRYIHAADGSVEEQLRWMKVYFERANDYYFVVEARRAGESEGLVSVYEIDAAAGVGEWGRWILRPGSLAAVESAWLLYKVCFEVLNLAEVYCRTVSENTKTVSFHDSCGIARRLHMPAHVDLGGRRLDAIEHRVCRGEWPALSERLGNIARQVAKRVNRA